MLKNTAFHDDVYQLAKIITVTTEGLTLDLSEKIFLEKTISDIYFVSKALQSLFTEVQKLSHLAEYLPVMHCLYSCENDYLLLLRAFAAKTLEKNLDLPMSAAELTGCYKMHSAIKDKIETCIRETDKNFDTYRIVSQNELAELLCV